MSVEGRSVHMDNHSSDHGWIGLQYADYIVRDIFQASRLVANLTLWIYWNQIKRTRSFFKSGIVYGGWGESRPGRRHELWCVSHDEYNNYVFKAREGFLPGYSNHIYLPSRSLPSCRNHNYCLERTEDGNLP